MTLTDPVAALADQSSFIDYLLGVAGAARAVRTLADDTTRGLDPIDDDFTYVLLGIASLGAAIDRLGESACTTDDSPEVAPLVPRRWLR